MTDEISAKVAPDGEPLHGITRELEAASPRVCDLALVALLHGRFGGDYEALRTELTRVIRTMAAPWINGEGEMQLDRDELLLMVLAANSLIMSVASQVFSLNAPALVQATPPPAKGAN